MHRNGIERDLGGEHRHERFNLTWHADADRIADGELVTPHRHQFDAYVDDGLGRHRIAERRTECGRDIAAHPAAVVFRRLYDVAKRLERLANGHIDVALREMLRCRGED